jgi:rhamnogalacturonyl hydrolase YesR
VLLGTHADVDRGLSDELCSDFFPSNPSRVDLAPLPASRLINHKVRAFKWSIWRYYIYPAHQHHLPSSSLPEDLPILHTEFAMRLFTITSLVSSASALQNASTLPLSIQMAKSIMSRHEGIYTSSGDSSGPLQAGFVQKTFSSLIDQYPNHTIASTLEDYIVQSANSLLPLFANTSSALKYSMDRLSSGNAFIRLCEETGKEEYKNAVNVLYTSVASNPRNAEGGLWYYVYPNWSYLDGMFSFGPFWALHTLTSSPHNATAWTELQHQFNLLATHCAFSQNGRETGLLVHGYDDTKTALWANNTLGQSPHVWGRSLGWYVLGLLDTVTLIDSYLDSHAAEANLTAARSVRDAFAVEFQTRMAAIARVVDPATGAWNLLLDAPGRAGNYIESSGSSMLVWALLKGVRLGYLDDSLNDPSFNDTSYVNVGKRAYAYLRDAFVVDNGNGTLGWNGTVSVCSLNSTASFGYYTSRPILFDSVLGSAAFVGASAEVERLEGC